ncbi:phosphoinositide phosphatase SAC3-like isoform X2 [Phalaenopsis equestris]|uniref:phosphoinositide phosphatase SAC3-like isoform X2 n=1 Tax=Phalaenopsis equestris TaxID=78828 RepID=UPI0009E56D48|nr:phosphoinositide phosphatase SAC3-like isoform X2 [Phalaenopsis equestris]
MEAADVAPVADRIASEPAAGRCCLQKFSLYETKSNFYMIGRDKTRMSWRVLKVDRLEPFELNISEDSTTYSESECNDLLKRIHEGNLPTGGLKFVTKCYGIVGFIQFLGPYYMLLITGRRLIGAICSHEVYAVTKSAIITVPNSSVWSSMAVPKAENRYKKLLRTVDLTKDFFFSYSYHVMQSIQKNLCDAKAGHLLYETMFVWNEFLTKGIHNHLKNSAWTVALVYGFFTQAKLSISGKDFWLTLIARRSRHYAGTRYLKRGVNDEGSVANDVETEQIVFADVPGENPTQISSIVQNRGSIPLFWSQETSKLNMKPDIVLRKKDKDYEATRLHFENLVNRYGNPIIILNLIKTLEKKPRESILRAEFVNAIDFLNKDLSEESRLRFLHWDLHKHMRRKATNVLLLLGKVATYALYLTGFFYFQVMPSLDNGVMLPNAIKESAGDLFCGKESNDSNCLDDIAASRHGTHEVSRATSEKAGRECSGKKIEYSKNHFVKPPMLQTGILRTNCIDCLDRTNVAQYAYGLAALGHQLYALGLIDDLKIDLDAPLASELMGFYERMGDTLALQYGGSAAHNKVFSERRGQWKAATQSQEFFRTLKRYYSNAYMDAEKQRAINLFLGYFQPKHDKFADWELNPDQNCIALRSFMKRSFSDGSILHQNNTPLSSCCTDNYELPKSVMSDKTHEVQGSMRLSDSTPEISACKNDAFFCCTPTMPCQRLLVDNEHRYLSEIARDASTSSNFLDLDQLSSSGNLCEEETFERSTVKSSFMNSSVANLSSENVANCVEYDEIAPLKEMDAALSTNNAPEEFSDIFVKWVIHGETLSLK